MSEEGELKKQIQEMLELNRYLIYDNKQEIRTVPLMHILSDVIDEAKKDYPQIPQKLQEVVKQGTPEDLPKAQKLIIDLILKREEWFKKWFGDSS